MQKKLILFILLFSLGFTLNAQSSIKLSSKRNDDRSVAINFEKTLPGSYTVLLTFSSLSNAHKPSPAYTISGLKGRVTTLRPINKDKSINFRYSYRYLRGKRVKASKIDFVYALPVANGVSAKVQNLRSIYESYGKEKLHPFVGFRFTAPNDSVFAARKGTVIKIVNKYDPDPELEYSFNQKRNEIVIEHEDGTLATYSVLEKNSMGVEIGQTVYPGDFLALMGSYDKEENKHFRFWISYLDAKSTSGINPANLKDTRKLYAYLDPDFAQAGGQTKLKHGDTAEGYLDEEVITAEMSRRERKKRAKKK